jgi:alkyl sulfatase BDS1-like metallo-beta-lactamase superfamily hydrolase
MYKIKEQATKAFKDGDNSKAEKLLTQLINANPIDLTSYGLRA